MVLTAILKWWAVMVLLEPPFRKTFDENAAKARSERVLKKRGKSVAHKKFIKIQKRLDKQGDHMVLK